MKLPEIKPHYQRFEVEIVTEQLPNRPSVIEVPARTPQEAVEATANGGAREEGRYDWIEITCGNAKVDRPRHCDR